MYDAQQSLMFYAKLYIVQRIFIVSFMLSNQEIYLPIVTL